MKYAVLRAIRHATTDDLVDLALQMAEAHPETFEHLLGIRLPTNTFDVPNAPGMRVSFTAEQLNKISQIAPSNKISAIKLVREITGLGLKEAKDFVEIVILKQ